MKTENKLIGGVLALILLVSACATPTMITGSYRKPRANAERYDNVFVSALGSNIPFKQAMESNIQEQLQQRGLQVEKGIDVFPPNFNTTYGRQKDLVLNKIRATGADGILTVNLLKKSTESRYIGTGGGGYWNPGLRYNYYNTFWGYYNNWYPSVYSQGYYDSQEVYYIETNLYNARTEQLIWAAQSKTYDPANAASFAKGYVKAITDQMIKDGLISPSAPLATKQSE